MTGSSRSRLALLAFLAIAGFFLIIAIMLGFLLQWPTLLTLAMFPVLTWAYVRLARREEREVRATFADAYTRYATVTPAFVPRFKRASMRRA